MGHQQSKETISVVIPTLVSVLILIAARSVCIYWWIEHNAKPSAEWGSQYTINAIKVRYCIGYCSTFWYEPPRHLPLSALTVDSLYFGHLVQCLRHRCMWSNSDRWRQHRQDSSARKAYTCKSNIIKNQRSCPSNEFRGWKKPRRCDFIPTRRY